MILENLAAGQTLDEVAEDYDIGSEDVRAAVAYAADYLHDEISISVAAE